MDDRMRQIRQSLAGEIDCYRELLVVSEQERDILLSGGHERLMSSSERKVAISQRLAQMQGERRRLMLDLSPEKDQSLRLRDLTPYLPRQEQGAYRAALVEAQGLAERLSQLNSLNKSYVEEALNTVDHLLGILTGASATRGYSPQGTVQGPSRPRILTREV